MIRLRKVVKGSEVRYQLTDDDGQRAAILSMFPTTNRKVFARELREAKYMLRNRVGYFK